MKSFTLTLDFTCKCHCTSILSVSALLVDWQFLYNIQKGEAMPNFFRFSNRLDLCMRKELATDGGQVSQKRLISAIQMIQIPKE